MRRQLLSLPLGRMLPQMLPLVCLVFGATLASALPPQTAVPVGPCKQWVTGEGWVPCSSSGGGSSGDGGAAAAAAAARAAQEEERLGQEAAGRGAAAFARGDFKAAAIAYLTASRHQPANVQYKKARARALTAHRQSLGGVIDELRGADADQFDATGVAPTLRALPTVKEPTFGDSLARSFGITVNINDPANVHLKVAMSQMEDKIKYDRAATKSEGQIPPDPAGLEKSVAAFNDAAKAVRPPGAPPVTVEEVQAVYSRYKSGLTVKK